jgi:hypothetical protein
MQVSEVRLECLKLAQRHDKTPEQVVGNARVFEQYVTEGQRETLQGREPAKKRAG